MSIQKYETFLKIVERGSITKAAETLGYSQSAVSHAVATLETDWGVKLLLREKQGVRLTHEGELLLPVIRQVVEDNNELQRQAAGLHRLGRGVLHVAAFASVAVNMLPMLIKTFQEKHPQITFDVRQREYEEVERMILSGKLDCGILRLPIRADIDTVPLFRDRLLAVFPEGDGPSGETFPVEDIVREDYIIVEDPEPELEELLHARGIKLKSGPGVDYTFTLLSMVANGMGMCIVPEFMLRNQPFTFSVRPLGPPTYRMVGIGYRKESLSPAAKKFVEHVAENARDLAGGLAPL